MKVTAFLHLSEGANTIAIKVTAEDGTTKTYTVNVTRDGAGDFTQQAYVKTSNSDTDDVYGNVGTMAIGLDGDTLVVTMPGEDSVATGIGGDDTDNSAVLSGAAYVFRRTNGVWAQEAYIKASNSEWGDGFGSSIAIDGDTMVIGSREEDSSATGVNGNQADNSASVSGAAYVFVRSGTTWTQQAYLKASNTDSGDHFGVDVDISGDTIVVGAWLEDSNATGVNGDDTDDSASASGAAYVFVRSGTTWTQQAYLKASNTQTNDNFGLCVAISGDTIVVGAEGEDSNAQTINGDDTNNGAGLAGAAYVFVRSGVTWTQQAYLKADNAQALDYFGSAVAIDGDTIVVGAHDESSAATGVNGDGTDNSASASGAAYVFVRSGVTWTQQAYLKGADSDNSDLFGASVAIDGDTIVVGAYREAGNATGVGGDETNNGKATSGAAFVFTRSGTTWTYRLYLKGSDTDVGDFLGFTHLVAVSGDTVAAGALKEASDANGIDGDDSDDSAANSGAVYIFQ